LGLVRLNVAADNGKSRRETALGVDFAHEAKADEANWSSLSHKMHLDQLFIYRVRRKPGIRQPRSWQQDYFLRR
jgi:hypothetical protein